MPYLPKKACGFPGCPEIIEHNKTYCEEHKAKASKQYNKYTRNQETQKIYNSKVWRSIRDRYKQQHPLCEECLRNNMTYAMQEVHHKIPLNKGGTNEDSNLESLCLRCHAKKTAREFGR